MRNVLPRSLVGLLANITASYPAIYFMLKLLVPRTTGEHSKMQDWDVYRPGRVGSNL
jgi:hypothetical protein